MADTPTVGAVLMAETPTGQRVKIEVTALDEPLHGGWYVWGYRMYATGGGRRKRVASSYPSSYFIPDEGA